MKTLARYLLIVLCLGLVGGISTSSAAAESRELGQHPLQYSELDEAPCRLFSPPNNAAILKWLEQSGVTSSGYSEQTVRVNGILFKGQSSKATQLFKLLTTPRTENGYPEPRAKWLNVPNSCTDVVCAVQSIFGEREGLQVLYILARYGFNASEYAGVPPSLGGLSKTESYSAQELDDLLLALSDLPEHLHPLEFNRPLNRYKRGEIAPGYEKKETAAVASILTFDSWSASDRSIRVELAFHELAHVIAETKGRLDDLPEWRYLSSWTRQGENWRLGRPDTVVSTYSRKNPIEDFAESVVAYRYNPRLLKEVSQDKYNFIKFRVFNGIEYHSESACSRSMSPEWHRERDAFRSRCAQTRSQVESDIESLLTTRGALAEEMRKKPFCVSRIYGNPTAEAIQQNSQAANCLLRDYLSLEPDADPHVRTPVNSCRTVGMDWAQDIKRRLINGLVSQARKSCDHFPVETLGFPELFESVGEASVDCKKDLIRFLSNRGSTESLENVTWTCAITSSPTLKNSTGIERCYTVGTQYFAPEFRASVRKSVLSVVLGSLIQDMTENWNRVCGRYRGLKRFESVFKPQEIPEAKAWFDQLTWNLCGKTRGNPPTRDELVDEISRITGFADLNKAMNP